MISIRTPADLFKKLEKGCPYLVTPHGIMQLVIAMYVAKVCAKWLAGYLAGSMVMTADGFHNLSDIGEAGLVMLAVSFATSTGNGLYPFGRRNLESVISLVIGMALIGIAVQLFLASIAGLDKTFLLGSLAGSFPAGIFGLVEKRDAALGQWYWLAAIVSIASIALSFLVSSLQIEVGKKFARPVIVGDGKETRSDGMIECVVFAGISGEFLLGAPWIEYALGPVAALFVGHAGWELAERGWHTLLQRSIGKEHDEELSKIIDGVHGIYRTDDLKSFMIGGMAVVLAKAFTRCNVEMNRIFKKVIVERMSEYLAKSGFPVSTCYIRLEAPPLDESRTAYAMLIKNGDTCLAPDLAGASHICIVDMKRSAHSRGKDYPVKGSLSGNVELLTEKRVVTLVSARKLPNEEISELAKAGIESIDTPLLPTNYFGRE